MTRVEAYASHACHNHCRASPQASKISKGTDSAMCTDPAVWEVKEEGEVLIDRDGSAYPNYFGQLFADSTTDEAVNWVGRCRAQNSINGLVYVQFGDGDRAIVSPDDVRANNAKARAQGIIFCAPKALPGVDLQALYDDDIRERALDDVDDGLAAPTSAYSPSLHSNSDEELDDAYETTTTDNSESEHPSHSSPTPTYSSMGDASATIQAGAATIEASAVTFQAGAGTIVADGATIEADGATIQADAATIQAGAGTIEAGAGTIEADAATIEADGATIEADAATIEAGTGIFKGTKPRVRAKVNYNRKPRLSETITGAYTQKVVEVLRLLVKKSDKCPTHPSLLGGISKDRLQPLKEHIAKKVLLKSERVANMNFWPTVQTKNNEGKCVGEHDMEKAILYAAKHRGFWICKDEEKLPRL
ncbi:hypothetical protein B484DRAFT_448227, partial [Ochromonadaceae sp. CCMP2298]